MRRSTSNVQTNGRTIRLTILQSQDASLSIYKFEIHLGSGPKFYLNFFEIHTLNFFKLRTKIGHEDSYIFTDENGAIASLSFKVTITCSEIVCSPVRERAEFDPTPRWRWRKHSQMAQTTSSRTRALRVISHIYYINFCKYYAEWK